mmetsp:Transcript_33279/g.51792  ORF Transcript_33279/g.51792 Transcript_33279/m.51792 type:complete len:82 (+) Transcript_33279:175-420(+)
MLGPQPFNPQPSTRLSCRLQRYWHWCCTHDLKRAEVVRDSIKSHIPRVRLLLVPDPDSESGAEVAAVDVTCLMAGELTTVA